MIVTNPSPSRERDTNTQELDTSKLAWPQMYVYSTVHGATLRELYVHAIITLWFAYK